MRRVHIWVFCINLLGGFQLLFAQQEETTISIAEVDSLEINEKVPLSLRFGIDLYRIVLSQVLKQLVIYGWVKISFWPLKWEP